MDYCESRRWKPDHLAHVQHAIQRVVKEYEDAMPQPDQTDTPGHLDRVERRIYQTMKRRRVEKESETTRYLAAPAADIDVDVLGWWKFHAGKYPCLARIASHEITLLSPQPVHQQSACSQVDRLGQQGARIASKLACL